VVPAGRSRRPDPDPPRLELHLVDDDEEIGGIDLVELQQPDDRRAAQVHERERLGQDHVSCPERRRRVGPPPRDQRLDASRRRFPQAAVPPRQQIDGVEPGVVPRAGVLGTRIAQADDQLHSRTRGVKAAPTGRPYFFFSSSSSFLPFLMTSGSAGVAGVAAATAPSAGAGSASAFTVTTWTIIISASLIAFHLASCGRSRTRIPWCSISSLMSMSMCSGMSAGSTSTSISRLTKSTMPPCCLTPLGSPLRTTGTVSVSFLSIATA